MIDGAHGWTVLRGDEKEGVGRERGDRGIFLDPAGDDLRGGS